jgi:glutathione S-transferase
MQTLFYTPGACSMVSHIVLEEAGAPYARQAIDFSAGEQCAPAFLKINPKARVPALVTARGVLTENPAIIAYVAQAHPEARLAPVGDPFAFADVQAFNMYIATGIHVAFRQISRPDAYADGAQAASALRGKVPALADAFFALIEDRLADGRPFIHGDSFTISDPYLFVFANYLRMGDRGDASKIPHVIAHRDRIRQRPAVARVLEVEGLTEAWS